MRDPAAIHEPWTLERLPDRYRQGVGDHAAERDEALGRYREARG